MTHDMDTTVRTWRQRRPGMAALFVIPVAAAILSACNTAETAATPASTPAPAAEPRAEAASPEMLDEGKRVFRFETFGDDQLWTDKLRLHEVVEKSVDPATALKVGLKVDADMLPPGILGKVDLKQPGDDRRPAQAERGCRHSGHR